MRAPSPWSPWGAQVHRGDLTDLESLRSGAAAADGVIHTGFVHDFSKFAENCEIDKRAIEVFGSALEGSERPLLVTSGLTTTAAGRLATEEDAPLAASASYPRASEATATKLLKRGVRASVVRLPQVHDRARQGLVTFAIGIALEKGVCPYVGDGQNRWPSAHILDTARLYRLALEKAEPGASYHAVAEEGVSFRDITEVLGRQLKLPVRSISPDEAKDHFGWLAMFAGLDAPASSALTRQRLRWQPTERGMIADLEELQDS